MTAHKQDNRHREGALKTKEALLARDLDWYKKIGAKGGRNSTGMTGFALNPQRAAAAGRKGGTISRKRPRA